MFYNMALIKNATLSCVMLCLACKIVCAYVYIVLTRAHDKITTCQIKSIKYLTTPVCLNRSNQITKMKK